MAYRRQHPLVYGHRVQKTDIGPEELIDHDASAFVLPEVALGGAYSRFGRLDGRKKALLELAQVGVRAVVRPAAQIAAAAVFGTVQPPLDGGYEEPYSIPVDEAAGSQGPVAVIKLRRVADADR